MRSGKTVIRVFISVLAAGFSILVAAQPFPVKPLELVNAFAPGGANDLNARALQVAAERILGQPLVQTFRQGGGGMVGTAEVASATPDGYKLLIVTSGELTAAPNLARAAYSVDSFAFVARISSRPYSLVVKANASWNAIGELMRAASERPGKHTIGTTSTGGMFLTAQHFIRRGGVRLTTVPYGGAGPALAALLGGHIDSVWAPLAAAESHLKAGTLRLLAVSGPARARGHADVPSFGELGIDAPFVQWVGIVAPKGIAQERLVFLQSAFFVIARDPAYLEAAQKLGIEPAWADAQEFEKQVREEDRAFRGLVKDLGITLQ